MALGWSYYTQAISTSYVVSALRVSLLAMVIAVAVNTFFGLVASWTLTKFHFKGQRVLTTLCDIPFSISPVIAGLAFVMTFGRSGWARPIVEFFNGVFGTDVQFVFSVPGVVLATIFVTLPFVVRELLLVMHAQGSDEETAAALMGARGLTIFRRVTLLKIRWALMYGIVLCAARAIAPNPQALLLDEPFAAIDAKIRGELRQWLREMITRLGITSIFVTHDQEEAIEVSDRIIVMSNGKIEQVDSPTDIYEQPRTAFVVEFAGSAPVVKDVSFRGFYFELTLDVAGVEVKAHRGLGRRRPIVPGMRMLAYVDRLYVLHGDNSVEIVENPALEGKIVARD